jgi:hypothetical protein
VGTLHKDVGDAEEILEDGDQVGVVVVGGQPVLEEDALAGNCLIEAGCMLAMLKKGGFVKGRVHTFWASPSADQR